MNAKTADLLKANEQLALQAQAQKDLVSISAHELRTPTQSIPLFFILGGLFLSGLPFALAELLWGTASGVLPVNSVGVVISAVGVMSIVHAVGKVNRGF